MTTSKILRPKDYGGKTTMTTQKKIVEDILIELKRARSIHPCWPSDKLHAISIITEEVGELVKAGNQLAFDDEPENKMYVEAIQTAAMCIRFLEDSAISDNS